MYSAVQIKSNSVQDHAPYRWCSAPSGQRLPGREKDRTTGVVGVTDMTCACSQKRWELEQEKVRNIIGFETFEEKSSSQRGRAAQNFFGKITFTLRNCLTPTPWWRWMPGRM